VFRNGETKVERRRSKRLSKVVSRARVQCLIGIPEQAIINEQDLPGEIWQTSDPATELNTQSIWQRPTDDG
jgi:hypothetical protein